MGSIEERTLELNIISATDVKKVTTFGKQASYAVAFISAKSKKATKVDKHGGVNPSWNSKVSFNVEQRLLLQAGANITIEIYSPGSFGTKLVGTVLIPLQDVGRESKGSGEPQFMAYQVMRPSGKPCGILNVAIKLGEMRTIIVPEQQSWTPEPAHKAGSSSGEPAVAYPAQGYPVDGAAYPQQYPPQYEPQYAPQYPPQYQGYPPQQAYGGGYGGGYYPQQQPQRRMGGGGLGFGAGLLGGAVGGLLVADAIDDIGDFGDGGDF